MQLYNFKNTLLSLTDLIKQKKAVKTADLKSYIKTATEPMDSILSRLILPEAVKDHTETKTTKPKREVTFFTDPEAEDGANSACPGKPTVTTTEKNETPECHYTL